MTTMILLVSSCRGPCCSTCAFEAKHPSVVVDQVPTQAGALKLIPLAKPDLVVLGPDVQDSADFRSAVARLAPNTRMGALPCNRTGRDSDQCLAIRADFMSAVVPMLRASA